MNNLTEKERQAIKELVDGLKKIYGDELAHVILYGSKARGDGSEDSDIDILLVGKYFHDWSKEIDKTIDIVMSLLVKYDVLITIVPVSVKEFETVPDSFILQVKKEGIEL